MKSRGTGQAFHLGSTAWRGGGRGGGVDAAALSVQKAKSAELSRNHSVQGLVISLCVFSHHFRQKSLSFRNPLWIESVGHQI